MQMTQSVHARPVRTSNAPPIYTISWLFFLGVLLIVAFYYFLVCAFYINGLHHFTFDQIWFQNTPGSGNFPFSSRTYPFSVNAAGFFLIFPAIFISGTAQLFFPLYSMALIGMLGVRWRTMSWGARVLWLVLSRRRLARALSHGRS